MPRKFHFGTAWRIPSPPPRSGAISASEPDTQSSACHDVIPPAKGSSSNPGPTATASTCHFTPFDEQPDEQIETPHWETDLDNHFAHVFKKSALSTCSIDDVVAQALHIIGSPTQAKIHALARAIYMHWIRRQIRSKNANTFSPKIVALISKLTEHLGCLSVHAEKDFLHELNHLCIEKLKLTWRLYVAVAMGREALAISRANLFKRVMAATTMIGHLFRGSQFQYSIALCGLEYIAIMSPWADALVVIHALLRELGPKFALERPGRCFIQSLLADLLPLTVARAHSDRFCQSIFAINTLMAEWYNDTCVTVYNTYPGMINQYHAHLLQM